MINSLKEVFPHLDKKECLEIITEDKFEIIDDIEGEKAYIVEDNGQFKIYNPTEKDIYFLSVDDCLFSSSDESRADCIIFDSEYFCFIELKHCKNKKQTITKRRRKSKSQLIASIEFFQKNLEIKQKFEAYICVTCSTNEEKITMTPRANNEEAQLEFEEYYNTTLFYSCTKQF